MKNHPVAVYKKEQTVWKRIILLSVSIVAFAGVVSVRAQAPTSDIVFNIQSLSAPDQAFLRNEIITGRDRVKAWWGDTFSGRIEVRAGADVSVSMALLPAWRGEHGLMLFPDRGVRSRFSPVVHELIHVYTPNQNRFLAEGLAVYGQQHLEGAPAYPNFGKDLHELARDLVAGPMLENFDKVETPSFISKAAGVDERVFYILSGSFLRYLIESQGLEKFRALYAMTPLRPKERGGSGAPERWRQIYGATLAELELRWHREALKQ